MTQPTTGESVFAIVLCYNHAEYVAQALDSVEAQGPGIRALIVDDGSKDASHDVIRTWLASRPARQERFSTLLSEHNRGIPARLNQALNLAPSDTQYVMFLAADDFWEADKTLRQLRLFSQNPGAEAIFGDAFIVDALGNRRTETFLQTRLQGQPFPADTYRYLLTNHNFLPAMSAMLSRRALQEVGMFDESLSYEDYDLWLRLARRRPFLYLRGNPVASYRLLATSMSARTGYGDRDDAIIRLKHLPADPAINGEVTERCLRSAAWAMAGNHGCARDLLRRVRAKLGVRAAARLLLYALFTELKTRRGTRTAHFR